MQLLIHTCENAVLRVTAVFENSFFEIMKSVAAVVLTCSTLTNLDCTCFRKTPLKSTKNQL